jgi:ABC-2 type transport system ATP-binding protein
LLVFDQISQYYGGTFLFQNLSFSLDAPRIQISGANGSGKTTLLLLAAGLLKPHAGHVSFRQQDVLLAGSKRQIGISANKVALPAFMTVTELLRFQAQQFGCDERTSWIAEFGLDPFMLTQVADLSLGNYKKLSLITALLHQPELLLLDEPSNGLDEHAKAALSRLLRSYPGQVIVASHDDLALGDLQLQHLSMNDIVRGAL